MWRVRRPWRRRSDQLLAVELVDHHLLGAAKSGDPWVHSEELAGRTLQAQPLEQPRNRVAPHRGDVPTDLAELCLG